MTTEEQFVVDGKVKAVGLAKGGAELDGGAMAATRAWTINQCSKTNIVCH